MMWTLAAVSATALLAALPATPAGAASSASFVDAVGDARRAPDITSVDVSHADTGVLTFAMATPSERTGGAGSTVRVLLDTDRNAATGEAGADWAVVVTDGRTVAVHEWWVAGWIRRIPRGATTLAWVNGPAVSVDRGDLGWTTGFGLRVEAGRAVAGVAHRDHAPEQGSWAYEVAVPDADGDRFADPADNCPYRANRQFDTDADGAGNECDVTPYPVDTVPPAVQPLPSQLTRGGVAFLRYRLWEDSRSTRERVTVHAGGRTLAVLSTQPAPVDDGVAYAQLWRAPKRLATAQFCVRASDEAGNASEPACAPLTRKPPQPPVPDGAGPPSGALVIGGRPTFVLGLSNAAPLPGAKTPDGRDALAAVVAAGINLMRVEVADEVWTESDVANAERLSSAAAAVGARTWVALRELALASPGSPEADLLDRLARRLRGNRGFGLWKGRDEPWWDRRPAAALEYAYRTVRALTPDHPVLTVQAPRGTRWDLAPYSAVADAQGVNVYPVAFTVADPPLHEVGRRTAILRAATPGNGLVTTLQICSGGSFDRSGTEAFVLPTLRQQRYMAYDAIINGARGLVFFGARNRRCHSGADVRLGWNWTFWRRVLAPLLGELGADAPIHRALLAPRSRLRLRVSDATTQVEARGVGEDELWVLAARHGRGTRPVRISGLPAWAKKATVYREHRTLGTANGSLTDHFGRWGVHVYRFSRR